MHVLQLKIYGSMESVKKKKPKCTKASIFEKLCLGCDKKT